MGQFKSQKTLEAAMAHHQAGRFQEADTLYQKVLKKDPRNAQALYLRGLIAYQTGRTTAGIDLVQRAINAHPDFPEALSSLGSMLQQQGRLDQAAEAINRALALRPEFADAYNNLGNVLRQQGRQEEALAAYLRATRLRPNLHEAQYNLGRSYAYLGRHAEAMEAFERTLALNPGFTPAIESYASALVEQGRLQDAAGQFRKAIERNPGNADLHRALGNCLKAMGDIDGAAGAYKTALAANPKAYGGLKINLATLTPAIMASRQMIQESRERFESAVDALLDADVDIAKGYAESGEMDSRSEIPLLHDPLREVGVTNFHLSYHGLENRELHRKTARLYELACPMLLHAADHCLRPSPPTPGERIRVGFISRFMHNHSIGKTTRGLIAKLDRDRFEVHAIFVPPVVKDEISSFIMENADHVTLLPDDLHRARQVISESRLHILFYQDIGMEPFTYYLSFARLAPVQCLSFGHPDTTGVRNMDYFVTTEHFDPPGAESHYTERLYRIKDVGTLAYYYQPRPPERLKSRGEFDLPEDRHLYVCPQNLFKLHPDFDQLLAGILRRDPRGLVVLIEPRIAQWRASLESRFREHMPDVADRIVFHRREYGSDFLNLLAVCDVMLDTPHFNGMNTTLEAFAAGTPVVTLAGDLHRARHTRGMYAHMGFMDCVAGDKDEYVEIAIRLGTDPQVRQAAHEAILERRHKLYEDANVVRGFERFFEEALSEAVNRELPEMRVAVITPYYKEPESVLRMTHESVLNQSYPCEHFMVADGFPADFVDEWNCHHIKLPSAHGDNGNTPRGIGALTALNEGFDAVCYLDADNWFHEHHVRSLVELHQRTGAPICTSARTIHRLDGSLMEVEEIGDGSSHNDTSCLFMTREACWLLPLWLYMPKELGPVCDRVFWLGIRVNHVPHAHSGARTMAFRSQYVAHYQSLSEEPPPDAKPMGVFMPSIRYWNGLTPRERENLLIRLDVHRD